MHIGDGFLCDNFLFDNELERLLLEITKSDKETELVIVGDGLELIESRMVKDLGLIPFDDLMEKIDPCVIDHIFNNHEKVFNALKKFCRIHKLTYLIGNHDYFFLKKKRFRDRFKELIGNGENVTFAPYFYDKEWGVFAYHGNNFDPGNRFGEDKKTGRIVPPIGDYITRYMMIYFRDILYEGDVPEHVHHDYDDVRPNVDIFDWFSYIMKTYDLSIDLVEIWMGELLKLLNTVQARRWMKSNYPFAHRFSKFFISGNYGIKLGRFFVSIVSKLRGLKRTNYMKTKAEKILCKAPDNPKYAFSERDFFGFCEKPEIDYKNLHGVIFAHRHKFENYIMPYSGKNKFYINTGTWRNVIEKDWNHGKKKFVKSAELACVIIDEENAQLNIQSMMQNKIENKRLAVTEEEVG